MGQHLRRCQDDHRSARSPDPSLPHPCNGQRQLPLQGKLCRTQIQKRINPNLDLARSGQHITCTRPGQFLVIIPGQFSVIIPGQFSVLLNIQGLACGFAFRIVVVESAIGSHAFQQLLSGPHRGPQNRPDRDEHERATAVKPMQFMADFRGFFNHSRALANWEMVPLRGFEPLTPSLRMMCSTD